jgi:hypothetical protein
LLRFLLHPFLHAGSGAVHDQLMDVGRRKPRY